MTKTIALLVIVGGGLAAYLLLRSKALAAPSSPTIAPPVAPGHTTT